ncbi:MAG TPA: hypothetical protein VLZ75_07880 [Chitinophagales bacterium]|nr:hypothetical protein [Chitinophagales bacterium]
MKKIKIQYIFLTLILLLMGACKKDTVEKPDIPKGEDRDIRVLKVQYLGHDYFVLGDPPPLMYARECTYHYDTEGRLSYIENDGIRRATIEYNPEQIKATNDAEQNRIFSLYWDNSTIKFQGNRIENIMVTTRHLSIEPQNFTTQDGIDINRASDGRLKSVMLEVSPDAPVPSSVLYLGLATEILSYNDNGLPDKLETPLFYWADPDYYTADFTFQYNKADDVPMKLKRLVNEELLLSNRYGITNFDLLFLDSTRNFSQLGEGNWLISFGLPQFYILEEKSTHLVSKRTTNYYKGGINENEDPDGSKEFFKTTEEDFPYIHDAKAKTLEIAGLKIWYKFVE